MSDGEWDAADERRAEIDLMKRCCKRRGCTYETCFCPSDAAGVTCSAKTYGKPQREEFSEP